MASYREDLLKTADDALEFLKKEITDSFEKKYLFYEINFMAYNDRMKDFMTYSDRISNVNGNIVLKKYLNNERCKEGNSINIIEVDRGTLESKVVNRLLNLHFELNKLIRYSMIKEQEHVFSFLFINKDSINTETCEIDEISTVQNGNLNIKIMPKVKTFPRFKIDLNVLEGIINEDVYNAFKYKGLLRVKELYNQALHNYEYFKDIVERLPPEDRLLIIDI